uniref:beta-1,4-galactosyltransferase 1-like n=1 Tax=Styela clava TaxID=7725 RepID=UPI001939BC70|nr:beta-1,4-galactosyltransferase 1-like [Styela clava]
MRFPPAKLCLLVSSLAFFNFGVFVMFAPKQWKAARFFRLSYRKIDDYVIPNITVVGYRNELVPTYDMDCQEDAHLFGNITVNMSAAEETYWTISNIVPPVRNLTSNETCKYLGQHAMINGTTSKETAIFEPIHCRFKHSVAIIIPFRDREEHLRILLGHLIPILQRQLIRYSVFVVSQMGKETFNKGRLMNTGFEFAVRTGQRSGIPFSCFIFQDVDLLPEYDTLRYQCSEGRNVVDHLSTSINKFDYKPLCCGMTVGGVVAFGERQYRKVNGFPNSYWGWGGEDDDINKRIHFRRLSIVRPKEPLGRYTMIKHDRDKLNPWNSQVDRNVRLALRRIRSDGLNNLNTKIVDVENYPLFTNVLVDVGTP